MKIVKFGWRWMRGAVVVVGLLASVAPSAALAQAADAGATKAMALSFGGTSYLHRWSQKGQNEFTPEAQGDLAKWSDMVTINVLESVKNPQQLAAAANAVLGNYKGHGKVLRTDSRPATADRPAEHLAVAVLGSPEFLESAFARVMLVDGVGMIVVYSHRVYGKPAGPAMGQWLQDQGAQVEKALMTWDQVPTLAVLRALPQAQ